MKGFTMKRGFTLIEFLVCIAAVGLIVGICHACSKERPSRPKDPDLIEPTPQPEQKESLRFQATFHGYFRGGYGNHERAIYVIKDTETGVEYLSITGCGTTELWTERRNKKNVTVEE
ncbi:MAG: hypothetical protein AMXMBFR7_33000 [Planctomycetota bacterium]